MIIGHWTKSSLSISDGSYKYQCNTQREVILTGMELSAILRGATVSRQGRSGILYSYIYMSFHTAQIERSFSLNHSTFSIMITSEILMQNQLI